MGIKQDYQKAYRHFRIQNNLDDYLFYWMEHEEYTCHKNDLPKEVNLCSEDIVNLNPLAIGNAVKSLALSAKLDAYSIPFLYRQYDVLGHERYQEIMKRRREQQTKG